MTPQEHDALVNALAREIIAAVKDGDDEISDAIPLAVALWQAARDPHTDASIGGGLSEALVEAGHVGLAARVDALVESAPWREG
jgi:hypothetical protein